MSDSKAEIGELRLEAETLRSSAARPRVHGNGFVQLDLTERRRLHVWGDPRIPRQVVPSQIHDHTFSFRSRIVVGQLVHRTISVVKDPAGGYDLYKAVVNHGEDTRLLKQPGRVSATITNECLIAAGEQYTFQATRFHETLAPWPCVTVIEKDGPTLSQGGPAPRVLVPARLEPDNTFDRYQTSPELLWQIIFENLESGRILK